MSISSNDSRYIVESSCQQVVPTVSDYRDAFWGDGGVEILLQNTKQANNSSKELEGFVRDRAKAEEQIGKDILKAAKHNAQVGIHVGSFAPAWMELVFAYSEKLANFHLYLATQLFELAKEVGQYHVQQKEQYRLAKEQAVIPCSEAMASLDQATYHANKCKVAYHSAYQQACELADHVSKFQRDSHKQKELEKLESRLKKAESHTQQSESDYKSSLQRQETARQDFKDKMIVMADRLQKNEIVHLDLMKKFVSKMVQLERKMEGMIDFLKKHQTKEASLTAELMVQQFVAVKGSNNTLRPAMKFVPPPTERRVVTPQLAATVSVPNISPDPAAGASGESSAAASQAKKKWLRKKKKEKNRKDKGDKDDEAAGDAPGSVDRDNVDEEGYSIRPEDADRVGTKDDKDSDFSYGSDSDGAAETESKLKTLSIKPISAHRDRAISTNSSDLTAAVQSLSILKPPARSNDSSTSSRQSPARNILDDDFGGPPPPMNPAGGSVLEPMGLMSATPVSSGSGTPDSSLSRDRSSSGLMKPQVLAGLSSSPARFTPDSPRSQSPMSTVRRMSGSSLGSSSFTAGASSPTQGSLAVYALFNETVNALFKGADLSSTLVKVTGELQLSFPASCISQISPLSPPLVVRLHPTNCVDQAHANTYLLESNGSSPNGDACYKFKMGALQAFLKTQYDASPTAAFFKVDIFKYQAKVTSAAALPIHVNCLWKCEDTVSNLKVNYTYNPQSRINPAPIKFVTFLTPTEGVSNVQTSGTYQWANDRLTWKVAEVAPGTTSSLLAKMDLKSGPGRPSPVAVQFALDGHSLSGLRMDVATPGYSLALLKHRLSTGKYMAEPLPS